MFYFINMLNSVIYCSVYFHDIAANTVLSEIREIYMTHPA